MEVFPVAPTGPQNQFTLVETYRSPTCLAVGRQRSGLSPSPCAPSHPFRCQEADGTPCWAASAPPAASSANNSPWNAPGPKAKATLVGELYSHRMPGPSGRSCQGPENEAHGGRLRNLCQAVPGTASTQPWGPDTLDHRSYPHGYPPMASA